MLELLQQYQYIFLFVGILITGEVILLPGLYFATTGAFELYHLLIIAIIATVLADSGWYILGRTIPIDALKTAKLIQKREYFFRKASRLFDQHGLKFLFFSKFVYGCRIITQILCGANRTTYVRYITVNTLSTVVWLMALLALCFGVSRSIDLLRLFFHRIGLLFT